MAVQEDHDDIPEPDLEALWEAASKSGRLVRFGRDGRPRYGHDSDATIGYKSANSDGKAGYFMGYDLHLAVAAPTVASSIARLHSAELADLPEFVVGMSLDSAGTDCGPISARIVLEAREMCSGIGAVSADRGITQRREVGASVTTRQSPAVGTKIGSEVGVSWTTRDALPPQLAKAPWSG